MDHHHPTPAVAPDSAFGSRRPAAWAVRRPDRALPALPVPALAEIDGGLALLAGQRRLVALFTVRTVAALAVLALCLGHGWWPAVLPAAGIVYASALTAVHHLIHGPLGLSSRVRHLLLTVLAAVVAESGHALQATHLAHHRTDDGTGAAPADPEGYIEHVPWRRMPLEAVRFRYRLMGWALRFAGPVHRRRIRAEVATLGLVHLAAVALGPVTWWPAAYLVAMAGASASFAVMAGKGPQTNWGRPVASPLVRVRTRWGAVLLLSHDRHLEHHAYPEVPLPRLRFLDHALRPVLDRLPLVEVRLP
jgi:fatty acid desaturase